MAGAHIVISDNNIETPLLADPDDVVEGTIDYKGRPAKRNETGRWGSVGFVMGLEMAEAVAIFGIKANLISYLTGPLGQSTASAAANVNVWSGSASLLPLVGGFVADSFLGRYRTIIVASVLHILSLGFLTLAALFPTFKWFEGSGWNRALQLVVFYISLYMLAIGKGLHRPCAQAFGADQFDALDPKESKEKRSFFNWWNLGKCLAGTLALLVLTYIQDNLSWVLGFGIPGLIMVVALVWFLLGTMTYRFPVDGVQGRPYGKIGRVLMKAARNWRTTCSAMPIEDQSQGVEPHLPSQQLKFLNKALVAPVGSKGDGKVCSISEVEEVKAVFRLFPIWFSCLVYGIINAQAYTLFTKQGGTMERSITPGFEVPAASLQAFISITTILSLVVYDRIFVPIARPITRKSSGITMLQRVGTGLFISFVSIGIAALVERERLRIAQEYGLVDNPKAIVPMSVIWLIPQYLLLGVAEAFTPVGLQEFFYYQVPSELKCTGLALYLSIFGIGGFLSSILISLIEKVTSGLGHDSWFANNLNKAHLDYFYWILAGLSLAALIAFLFFAKAYVYLRN